MKRWTVVWIILLGLLVLTGCNTPDKAGAAAEIPPVVRQANGGNVIVEGVVTPSRSSYLAFKIGGDVVDVLVEEGARVEAGALLAHLDTRLLSFALASAEQDVLMQEAALQRLLNGASDKVIARVDKANTDQIDQAKVVLAIKELQLAQAEAENPALAVDAARARIAGLKASLAQAKVQDPVPAVTAADVTVERSRIALEDVQDEYDKALDRPWEDQEIRDAWADQLEQRQLDYKAAQAQLEQAQNAQKGHQISLNALAAQIQEAETQLAQALTTQETYTLTLQMLAAEVQSAELQLEALQANDNPYRDEASAEEIVQAQALLEKTRIGVETLKVQLEDAELTAPFAGTVVEVHVDPGDQASPGQVVIVLAKLDELEVHTTDLTELDIGGVAVGQPVKVKVDALSDRQFAGTVDEIALQGTDYRGDVVYQVTVKLDEAADPALLWGMTTMVEIVTK